MASVDAVGGSQAVPPPQSLTSSQSNWEQQMMAGYLAIIELLQGAIAGYYVPAVKDATLLAQVGKMVYMFLTQDKKNYMPHIDEELTEFLNGFAYLQQLDKEGKLPPNCKTILDNPLLKKLFSTLQEMSKLDHNDPRWKKLEQEVIGDGGLLDQINTFGQDPKNTDFVNGVQIFAEITGMNQQTLYQLATAELKKMQSMTQSASTFLKDIMSISQFITSQAPT
jgi:hypothetical protein